MKKLIEQIKEKALLGAVMGMLGVGGTFIWGWGKEIINQPETNKQLKAHDSIGDARLRRLEKQCIADSGYLENDYRDIQNIKTQTGIK